MASNKHAQVRYKVLDDCFSNFRRKFYINDLLERCNEALREIYGSNHSGIKIRTLRSDISYMRDRAGEAGVDIEVLEDGNGNYYRYSERDFSIYKHGLGEDDLAQLKETIMMLQRFNGMPNLDWMSELVVKLEDKLNLRGASQSVVGYDENKSYTGLDWFQDIFDAIINRIVLRVIYTTFTNVTYEWIIHPYYIKEYNNRWFLFGLNEENGSISNIALDRIDAIEQVKHDYISSNIDIESYLANVVGVSVLQNKIENIQLKFSSNRFPYVMTKAIHSSQRIIDIENRIIEISVIPNNELDALILSYGRDIEVLFPIHYRAKIESILKDSYEKYLGVQIGCTGM